MVGNEDLGEDIVCGGHKVHFATVSTLPDDRSNKATNGGDAVTGMVGNEDLGEDIVCGGHKVHFSE